jgi:hypothetical protein
MFTDIAGYTALMQADENQAANLLARYRKTLAAELEVNDGVLLQHMGDGSLTMFQSAVDAVQCAVNLQRTLQKEPQVPLRAGIHLGDIVVENDGVYGDGVNVASRIEQLAEPGSVVITQPVFHSIRNQRKFRVKYLGSPKLKNVLEPTRVYALRNPGLVVPERITRLITLDLRSIRSGIYIAALTGAAIILLSLILLLKKSNKTTSSELQRIIVQPLRNLTGEDAFSGLGKYAATQISQTLNETGCIEVLSTDSEDRNKSVILHGTLYNAQDFIIYQVILKNGNTGVIDHVFSPQTSPKSNPEEGLQKIIDEILGYLLVDQNSKFSTPKFSAYQDYIEGLSVIFSEPADAIEFFTKSLLKDPQFNLSKIGLVYAHYINSDYRKAESILGTLQKSATLTAFETQMANALRRARFPT